MPIRQRYPRQSEYLQSSRRLPVLQFLRQQAQRGHPVKLADERPAYLYPTVALPASSLDALIGIVPAVDGDALADTEALYDEV